MRYFVFLFLVLVLSIPFYFWGAFFPVAGVPFGLPISFLMILVPFFLALLFAWKEKRRQGVIDLVKRVGDFRKADRWALLVAFACIPLVAVLAYFTMTSLGFLLPVPREVPYQEIPLMILLFFLGAIPEELGWTAILTEPLASAYGPLRAGIVIGAVWGAWHIIPWSWTYPSWWIAGMLVLDILMRTAMVYLYMHGGRSLFTVVIFHALSNVAMEAFPNGGSHMNPWFFSLWMALLLLLLIWFIQRRLSPSKERV